jgi:hypothetical protein
VYAICAGKTYNGVPFACITFDVWKEFLPAESADPENILAGLSQVKVLLSTTKVTHTTARNTSQIQELEYLQGNYIKLQEVMNCYRDTMLSLALRMKMPSLELIQYARFLL